MKGNGRTRQRGAERTETGLRPQAAWIGWIESLGIAGLLLAIGALIDRRDPFLLHRGFSWLALSPLLSGLQYGSGRGLAIAGVQTVALIVAWKSGLAQVPDTIGEILLGWFLTGLIAGEFRDAWARRSNRLDAFCAHARRRLESLGRAYLSLKISYDRVRRAGPRPSVTLHDALRGFRRELAEHPERASLQHLADRVLALFAEHGSVRAASLHPVDRKGRPAPAIGVLGPAAEASSDPLVLRAARSGRTVSVREGGEGAVLVAVPLIDAACRTLAVVAVHDLPFPALHQETLEVLAVLGGRLGDAIANVQATRAPAVPPIAVPKVAAPAPVAVPARVGEAA